MKSAHRQRKAIAIERERAAIQAAHAIAMWLHEERVSETDRIQVISEMCSQLFDSDKSALGPLEAALPEIPLSEVIRLFRPALLETDEDHTIAWFAQWLAHWTLDGTSDDGGRARALEHVRVEKTTTSYERGTN